MITEKLLKEIEKLKSQNKKLREHVKSSGCDYDTKVTMFAYGQNTELIHRDDCRKCECLEGLGYD